MSVTINLLPDIRQARLRDQRLRRTVTSLVILVWSVAGGAVLLLFLFSVGQKAANDSLTKQIAAKEAQLQSTDGLLEALTAQQHLAALPSAWKQRVFLTNFFKVYSESNPNDVDLKGLAVTNTNQLNVNGVTNSYQNVTKLAKAMEASSSFTDVAIQSAVLSETGISFTLTAGLPTEVTNGK